MRKGFILFVAQILFFSAFAQKKIMKYSKIDFIEDINFLHDNIKVIHPNYVLITPAEVWEKTKSEMILNMPDSISLEQYIKELNIFFVLLRDGHSQIDVGRLWRYGVFKDSNVFPFPLFFKNGKAFIDTSFYKYPMEHKFEVVEINGIPIPDLLNRISKVYIHENNLQEYLNICQSRTYLASDLPEVFKLLDIKAPYKIKIRKENDNTFEVSGISIKELKRRITTSTKKEKAIELIKIDDNTALLKINTFLNWFIDSRTHLSKHKIDKIMKKANRYKSLIIDIRTNLGGNPLMVYYTFDFFIDSLKYKIPTTFLNSMVSNVYSEKKMKRIFSGHCNSTDYNSKIEFFYGLPKAKRDDKYIFDSLMPDKKRINHLKHQYKGNVYLLIGEGCYSGADEFADLFKYYKNGLLVGDSTGGFSRLTYFEITKLLPKSGIQFKIRPSYNLSLSEKNFQLPISPNICIKQVDFNNDAQLQCVLELIKKGITIKNYTNFVK